MQFRWRQVLLSLHVTLYVSPEIASCVHSAERPEVGMCIVSCGPLEGADPAYLQRCDVVLVDEYLSRFCLFLILQEISFLYRRYFIFHLVS